MMVSEKLPETTRQEAGSDKPHPEGGSLPYAIGQVAERKAGNPEKPGTQMREKGGHYA